MPYGASNKQRLRWFSPFSGRRRLSTELLLVQYRRIYVDAPMQSHSVVEEPDVGWPVQYTRNVHQRMFSPTLMTNGERVRVFHHAELYSTPETGTPPSEASTWTPIPGTSKSRSAREVIYDGYNEDTFTGLDYIGIRTVVRQDPRHFTKPFEIIHELWADAFWISRGIDDDNIAQPPAQVASMSALGIIPTQRKPGVPNAL